MTATAALIALALAGCGTTAGWTDPDFEARIATDFTPEETAHISTAFEEWFEAIPEARIPVTVSDRPNINRMSSEPRQSETGGTVIGSANREGIALWADAAGEHFPGIARHEIGHFLGAWGHTDDGEALTARPRNESPTWWPCISAEDIAAVCEGRGGCNGKTTPSCK